jgi:hypothetical protein
MKKPNTKISDYECLIMGEDRKEIGKTQKGMFRVKVKRISLARGELISDIILKMRC